MDKLIEELFKVFSHLAREIQAYVFSGFILLLNIFLIDFIYYDSFLWDAIKGHSFLTWIFVIICYILGQFALALYAFLLEFTRLDLWLQTRIFKSRFTSINNFTDENTVLDKATILKKDERLYFHFIERNVNLTVMRWNFSSAFLLISIVDFIYLTKEYHCKILIVGLVSLFISWCFLILSIFTQKENADQISKLKTL
ncbi:MAG: hypothetical protein KDC15_03375 [Chitinophagaceae bacterium]|nr:hypothetical protein [Chitinophagaceae bacterium]